MEAAFLTGPIGQSNVRASAYFVRDPMAFSARFGGHLTINMCESVLMGALLYSNSQENQQHSRGMSVALEKSVESFQEASHE